jgi:ABC-type glycerol-3-phosphate transport system substrate-binding protein
MKIIKQVVFALMGATAVVFLLLGSLQNKSHAPPGFTVVEYWEKWNDPEAAQMEVIVDDFNKSVGRDKKIYVHFLSVSDIDQKTLISISAGVPPDIAGTWDTQIAQYAALGAVEQLDEMASEHGITEDYYLPVYWRGCSYNGHLYALISTPGTVALLYNKQIYQECGAKLRAAGLDPDRAPRTLDEFDKYAAILDTRDKSGMIQRAGYVPLQSWYIPQLSFWFGGDVFNPATGRLTLDSPATLHAYQWIQSYAKKLGPRALMDFKTGFGNFDSPENPFLDGKIAMDQQGPWMANYIAHLRPELSEVKVPIDRQWELKDRRTNTVWGVAPFPTAVPGLTNVSYNSFDALMIPSGARHPNEAFEFMAFVNRQDEAEKLNILHCKNCQLRHVSESFFAKHPNPYIRVFQDLAASPNARCTPVCPIWPEVYQALVDTAQAVSLEPIDPADAVRDMQARMQDKCDQFERLLEERRRLHLD